MKSKPAPKITALVHPGEILREEFMVPSGMQPADFGGHASEIAALVAEKAPVTPELAAVLSDKLGTTPGLWLNLQADYDGKR